MGAYTSQLPFTTVKAGAAQVTRAYDDATKMET
jgi:hypothetical protein